MAQDSAAGWITRDHSVRIYISIHMFSMRTRNSPHSRTVDSVGYLHLSMFYSYCRLLVWCLRLDRRRYMLLATRMAKIWSKSGSLFLVRYLKEAHLVVQKYVSQEVMEVSSFPLGIVSGLPSIIPGSLRLDIKAGDRNAIRGCLAFLAIFRVLKVPSTLKLQTITDPFTGV